MEHTKGPVAHTSCVLSEDEFRRDGLGLISTVRECLQTLHPEPHPELVGRGRMGSSKQSCKGLGCFRGLTGPVTSTVRTVCLESN